MKLRAFNIKVPVYCADEKHAQAVQAAVSDIAGSADIIGADVIGFHGYFKRNENIIVPVIRDVFRNGLGAISRHVLTLRKLK